MSNDLLEMVLADLQRGATFQAVADGYNAAIGFEEVSLSDLTGDGVSEMIVPGFFDIAIIGCVNGSHQVLADYTTADEDGGANYMKILYVGDLNANGSPEIVIEESVTTAGYRNEDVLEWDGHEFVRLIQASHGKSSPQTSRLARALYWYESNWLRGSEAEDALPISPWMNGATIASFRDLDKNGTKEIVLTDTANLPPFLLYPSGPWRGKQATFTWDGLHFLFNQLEMAPAAYRFQALQEADRLFVLGEFDRALALYQDVIFSDKLLPWSPARKEYIDLLYKEGAFLGLESAGPTAAPPPDDPTEYLVLSAYARFRIMLHHVVRVWPAEAKTVYVNLWTKVPKESAGHEFAEMARLFWNQYEFSRDVEAACDEAIAYAREHDDVLAYLGSDYHGSQSHRYSPEDICPIP